MKLKKFLSLLMMADNQFRYGAEIELSKSEQEDLLNRKYDELKKLEKALTSKGIDFTTAHPVLPKDRVVATIQVNDKNNKGLIAQIEAFPENIRSQAPEKIHCYTNGTGLIELQLPLFKYKGYKTGKIATQKISGYYIRISKGLLYNEEILYIDLEKEYGNFQKVITLEPWIHIEDFPYMAGDLHHHSIYSSPKHGGTDDVVESALEVSYAMRAAGLSYGALSDHHNIYNHEDWLATKDVDFIPIPSKEISTTNGHVMSMNCLEDVIYKIPNKEERTIEYLYDEFVRIKEDILRQDGLAQINHPMDLQQAISLTEYMKKHVDLFDTIEIWNGSVPMADGFTNYQAYKFWLEILRKGKYIPATSGSDTHNTKANDYIVVANWLKWFNYHISEMLTKGELNESLSSFAREFLEFSEKHLESLLNWAKEKLGSGCVQTFVQLNLKENPSRMDILKKLKEGRSFITNGPIVIPEISGKSCGQVYKSENPKIELLCTIFTKKTVTTLEVITRNGVYLKQNVSHIKCNEEQKISLVIDENDLEKEDFIVLRVFSDYTNQAITNPIFIHT